MTIPPVNTKPAIVGSNTNMPNNAITQKPSVIIAKPVVSVASTVKQPVKIADAQSAAQRGTKTGLNKATVAQKQPAAISKVTASVATAKASSSLNNTATIAQTLNSASEALTKTSQNLQQQLQKVNKAMINNTQEINKFFEENLNSSVQAFSIFAKSAEEISKAYFSFAQKTLESNIAATKSLFSCKNAQEAFDLQSNLARKNIDSFINEGTKLSQLSIDATNKALQPIQTRINQTVESIIKKAA